MKDSLINTDAALQIIEPNPIAYSFATPGWYMVLGLLLITIVIIALYILWRYKKNAYRRLAIAKINEIIENDESDMVFKINSLLKNIALEKYDRNKVASLVGENWLNFLKETAPKLDLPNIEWQAAFFNALYGTKVLNTKEITELGNVACHWIKIHDTRNF